MSRSQTCPRPSDCWGWLSPDDLVRIALGAYYFACRDIEAPPSEPWMVDGDSYADRESFRDALLIAFENRVHLAAVAAGLRRPYSDGAGPNYPGLAVYPEEDDGASESPGCRGGAPAVKGHGWPALAAAAGGREGAGSAGAQVKRSKDAAGIIPGAVPHPAKPILGPASEEPAC